MKSGAGVTTTTHFEYPLSISMFVEDWSQSQFWYNDATATALAKQLLENATHETNIAVVSCPSVFVQMKNLIVIMSY
jgi:Probable N6-adenine methyltransferase